MIQIRVMGNVHRHTIQCVLMANMFNEKIYIALWWWLLIVIILTTINFLYWLYVLNSINSSYQFLVGLVKLGVSLAQIRLICRSMRRICTSVYLRICRMLRAVDIYVSCLSLLGVS